MFLSFIRKAFFFKGFFSKVFKKISFCLKLCFKNFPIKESFVSRNIIIGWGAYAVDVSTDLMFSLDMLKLGYQGKKQNCSENYFKRMTNWTESCLNNSPSYHKKEFFSDCLNDNQEITARAKDCIWDVDDRFDDGAKYRMIGYSTLAHCINPFFIGLLIFISLRNRSVWKIPVPLVTKLRRFILECKFFQRRTNKYFMRNIVNYEDNLKECINFVNLSLITEASSESTFHIWIQTLNMMPFIILNMSGSQIHEFFNLRGFSILTSFISISTSFYNIR